MPAADVTTAEGRSHDRYQRAARTGVMTIAAYGVNVAARLITVPLLLAYVGPERYGLWVAISSFVALLAFEDFGLGAGIQNALAECDARGDRDAPKTYVSSGLALMTALFLVFAAAAFLALPHLPLGGWLKIKSDVALREVMPTAQAMLICAGLSFPTSLVRRIYNGYQEGYRARSWTILGRVAALAAIVLTVLLGLGLPVIAGTSSALPYIIMGLAAFALFREKPWLAPSLAAVQLRALARIGRTGAAAFGIQIGLLLVTSGFPLLIANRFGAADLPPYATTMALLGVPLMVLAAAVYPLWPAYGEAAARGDAAWVRLAFRRSLYLGAAFMLPVAAGAPLAGRWIIRIWTGTPEAVPDMSLLLACTAWSVLSAWSTLCMVLLNGLDRMAGQAAYTIATALLALAAGALAAGTFGMAGIVWCLVLACGLPRALLYGLDAAKNLRRLGA